MNDYRNPGVAEAMKVLGFVNRFSRGILRVEEELKENGNGEPEFSLNLGTAFMVIEHISLSSNEGIRGSEEKSGEKGEEKHVLARTPPANGKGRGLRPSCPARGRAVGERSPAVAVLLMNMVSSEVVK